MIAAGRQSQSPGGSADTDTLCVPRFVSPQQGLTCAAQSHGCVTASVTSGAAVWTECRSERMACVRA